MLYAFKVYYAQNYAGIIRQGLKAMLSMTMFRCRLIVPDFSVYVAVSNLSCGLAFDKLVVCCHKLCGNVYMC